MTVPNTPQELLQLNAQRVAERTRAGMVAAPANHAINVFVGFLPTGPEYFNMLLLACMAAEIYCASLAEVLENDVVDTSPALAELNAQNAADVDAIMALCRNLAVRNGIQVQQ